MWCIPPKQDAAFVAAMEKVLSVYQLPYDSRRPVVCMDEQPIQLVSHKRKPLPAIPGHCAKVDYEYVREGMCNAFMFVEPLGKWREVHVSSTKNKLDWAGYVQWLVNYPRFTNAERITLVCDNLNTHAISSLYARFAAKEAFRIAHRLELVYTPKHGSWLNMAEPELSVMTRQCLSQRCTSQTMVQQCVRPWFKNRNKNQIGINWQFDNEKARNKLKSLYPKIELK